MIGRQTYACDRPASDCPKSPACDNRVLAQGVMLDHTGWTSGWLGRVMKIIVLLTLAALVLWMQTRADATTRPRSAQSQYASSNEGAHCYQGYHKSSLTGRCVRNQFRLPSWDW